MPLLTRDELHKKLKKIKLISCDVDGVLTDGKKIYGPSGHEQLSFNIQDGLGIECAQAAGLEVIFLSSGESQPLIKRAQDLKVQLHGNFRDKGAMLKKILIEKNLKPDEVLHIGDDINDIPAFQEVGLVVAVQNAVSMVKEKALRITERVGGEGAVREILDEYFEACTIDLADVWLKAKVPLKQ